MVLGGGIASYDLVKTAKEMGVYTIVTDYDNGGAAKEIANETAMISTADIDTLVELVKEKNIDGVFSGPSEFNLQNVIRVCEKAGLPCSIDMDIWRNCANKDYFKRFCREYGVDCTPEYDISENSTDAQLQALDYPIIVKPVDSSSSTGVTTCRDWTTVRDACRYARSKSGRGNIIVEKFIENSGEVFTVRYLFQNGEPVPYIMLDDYVAEPKGKGLFGRFIYAPSKYSAYYLEHMDANVRKMLKGMGMCKGNAFIQALPYKGKIYFHEMGPRLSGGMVFKLAEPLVGINGMKGMIRYALGAEPYSDEAVKNICLLGNRRVSAQISVVLNPGKIGRIEGLEKAKSEPLVIDFLQYYKEGDVVREEIVGTLGQLFGRFTVTTDSPQEAVDALLRIQQTIEIFDTDGNKMNTNIFDPQRLKHME